MVAIPGNHDWYDGLVSFLRNFAESYLRRVGSSGPPRNAQCIVPSPPLDDVLGRDAFQSRSYFAVRLPHGWWLWGVDIQLDSFVDEEQNAYFAYAKALMEDHERVILCTARPSWTDSPGLDKGYYTSNRETLTWFVNRHFGKEHQDDQQGKDELDRVAVVLTGDKHHFVHYERREEEKAPLHLVTCGGGGAYLSSTHHTAPEISVPWRLGRGGPDTSYDVRECYPDRDWSRWVVSLRLYRIPFVNGILTPLLVAAIGVGLVECWLSAGAGDPASNVAEVLTHPPLVLATLALGVLLMAVSHLFRPKGQRVRQVLGWLPGVVHLVAHLGVALLVARAAREHEVTQLVLTGPPWSHDATPWPSLEWSAVAALGSLVVFTLYWPLSDLFGFHENEFFSAMRLSGYKSHLRIVVSSVEPDSGDSGELTITPYFIKKVPWNLQRLHLRWVHRDVPPEVVPSKATIKVSHQRTPGYVGPAAASAERTTQEKGQ